MYTVLLVDDEPFAIEGLQMFVDWEAHGFRICGVCENGSEALTVAQRMKPDVIVTDIRMPQMNGLELIERLQEHNELSATKFVVMSAYSEFAFAKHAMQLGVHNYLLKPIIEKEADEVFSQIRINLDNSRANAKSTEDGEHVSLPAVLVKKLKNVLQAIEELDTDRAILEVDSMCQENTSQLLESSDLILNALNIQCSKLIMEADGDSEMLIIPDAHESVERESQLDKVQYWIITHVKQAIGVLKLLRNQNPCTLTEIDRYVVNHYDHPLTIRDVAAKFHLNPVYLGKVYQDKFGNSLIDRMHDLRILKACEKLRETDHTISAIAEQVGYSQYHYFLRHFEQRTGMKPMEYRAQQV